MTLTATDAIGETYVPPTPTFAVVTSVPDPKQGGYGNMAMELDIWMEYGEEASEATGYLTPLKHISEFFKAIGAETMLLNLRAPVFHVGEILILDSEYGREVGYPGRKPSKWSVEVDHFDNVADAMRRAWEVNH